MPRSEAKLPVAESHASRHSDSTLANREAMASELAAKVPDVGVLARPKSERDARQLRMRDMEENLLETSLETMSSALAWNEYSAEELEETAIEQCEEEEAKRRRTARAASMPAGSAPVGLKLAANFIVGVMKARAVTATAPGSSGPLVQILLPAPVSKDIDEGRPVYPVLDME